MKISRILRYFLLMFLTFLVILFINLIIRAAIAAANDNGHLKNNMKYEFLMLISDEGDVVWSINKPDEIPSHYTLADVASFSRWYLKDYPVYTDITDDGLLVRGMPKDSLWRYNLVVKMSELNSLIHIFPVVLIIDFLLAIIIPFFILRRQEKKAEMERVQWISGVSHDIRTPLSIILGNAEKLMQELPPEDTAGKVIKSQALRIRELITDLNIETLLNFGTKKTNEKILLQKLVRDVLCNVMEQDEDNIYEVGFETDPSLRDYTIKADEGLIKRMLENIILNSMTHNPDGCKINVALSPLPKFFLYKNACLLTISDNGVGTDAGTLKKLNASHFDSLNYKSNSGCHDNTSSLKGNILKNGTGSFAGMEHGLGLAVVKKISKLYHYKISFSSDNGFVCKMEIS